MERTSQVLPMTKLPSCFRFFGLLVFAMVVSVQALPSCLAGPLATTNNAFSGTVNGVPGHDAGFWRGSEIINGFDSLSVEVDFAVFAPGSGFDDFLSGAFGVNDPTDGTKFVYAFQANTLSDDNGFGVFPPAGLSVLFSGYDPGEDADIVLQGAVAGTGAVPAGYELNNTSAEYNWSPSIDALGTSAVVYYTSPFAPQKDGVSVGSGNGDAGQSGLESFASPSNVIPEPSSLLLLAGGVAIVLLRRLRS